LGGILIHYAELAKNLIIAAGVILAIICLLLPDIRLACLVTLTICVSCFEVIGFMSLWGVTLNSVSTVYILICVGLAVDYSAHIAHAFGDATGNSEDKALEALSRIGPSVLHALLSTVVAMSVLAFTETYVVRVFFKTLLLVTLIAGAQGLFLLPVLLAMFGNSDPEKAHSTTSPRAPVDEGKSSFVDSQADPAFPSEGSSSVVV